MNLNFAYRTGLRTLGFVFLSAFLLWMASQQAAGASSEPRSEAPYEVKISDSGLVITWSADEITWESTEFGMRPAIDQYSHVKNPGELQLPIHSVTFAIPAGARLDHKVWTSQGAPVANEHPIALAPIPQGIVTNDAGEWIGGGFAQAPKDGSPSSQTVISVEEIGVMSGIRLGRATFSPLVIDGDELSLVQSAAVSIDFSGSFGMATKSKGDSTEIAHSAIEHLVVNSQHAIPASSSKRSSDVTPTVADWVIRVEKEGMVQIDQDQLEAFGISATDLNPTQLELTHLGTAVPILWSGDNDNLFEPDESFTFYAPEFYSRWAESTPFLLSNSGTPSPQMISRSGAPSGPAADGTLTKQVVIEENNLYSSECGCGQLPLGWDGDRWVWEEMRRPGAEQLTVDAIITDVDTTQPAFLTAHLIGFTEQLPGSTGEGDDHVVSVKLNGTLLGTLRWDGKMANSTKLTVPAGVLQAENSVELELIDEGLSIDGVWLDALEFEYVPTISSLSTQEILLGEATSQNYQLESTGDLAVFDVTSPYSPTVIADLQHSATDTIWSDNGQTERRYVAQPSNGYLSPISIEPVDGLDGHGTGATYVVIAPALFAESTDLASLIAHRESQGWTAHLETAEEIYTAFGDGDPKPEAIRDYLDWAYHTWDTRPEMVVLVGDGSTDPKQHKGGTATYIPPYLAEVDPWIGETAADNLMVAVDGVDHVPDMALGRLPVNSTDELAGVVQKILRYEQVKTVGTWNRNALIVADDNDQAGDFVVASQILINSYLEEPWNVITQFWGVDSTDVTNSQNLVLKQWQNGAGLVMYNGHSSRHQWAAERLFHIDDVTSLQNGSRLPLVIQMTCFTGSFQSSRFNTLDEQLVRQADGGAIATWGATGLGVATGHGALAEGAFNVLYGQENPTLGVAVMAGKAKLAAEEPAHLDLLNTFNLLGDPATVIKLDLTGENIFLPTITKQ